MARPHYHTADARPAPTSGTTPPPPARRPRVFGLARAEPGGGEQQKGTGTRWTRPPYPPSPPRPQGRETPTRWRERALSLLTFGPHPGGERPQSGSLLPLASSLRPGGVVGRRSRVEARSGEGFRSSMKKQEIGVP